MIFWVSCLFSWENFLSLKTLEIISCNFSGKVLDSLGDLLQLNYLTGEILGLLSNLTQLTQLNLALNQLSGPIPFCLLNLSKLSTLYL
ncbi:hypothetical protein WN943_011243 [Citrus x changshan-huyou]